ncbi:hypothetical protein AAY473_031540 [Plecturocebus cupreus]
MYGQTTNSSSSSKPRNLKGLHNGAILWPQKYSDVIQLGLVISEDEVTAKEPSTVVPDKT